MLNRYMFASLWLAMMLGMWLGYLMNDSGNAPARSNLCIELILEDDVVIRVPIPSKDLPTINRRVHTNGIVIKHINIKPTTL